LEEEMTMQIEESGMGSFKFTDPDEMREWVRDKKTRSLESKLMTEQEAVKRFVKDGDYLAFDLAGLVRGPFSLEREIVRQKKRDLFLAGKFSFLDCAFLVVGECVTRIDCGFMGGGVSHFRAIEKGEVEVIEWSNGAISARFQAGALGIPFIPWRGLMGTETFKHSAAKIAIDPFTGKKITLLPALNPDVSLIHANQCDIFGNARIFGPGCIPVEVATASKRVIISTEEIIDIGEIRKAPAKTTIPYYIVDAVVLAPFGGHPGSVPGLYDADFEHMNEFFKAERDPAAMEKYLDQYVYSCKTHQEYLEKIGKSKLEELKKREIREGYYE
jgi:acyl CoA:acetate/3-ketoacid CoA transferase alpha subunit